MARKVNGSKKLGREEPKKGGSQKMADDHKGVRIVHNLGNSCV